MAGPCPGPSPNSSRSGSDLHHPRWMNAACTPQPQKLWARALERAVRDVLSEPAGLGLTPEKRIEQPGWDRPDRQGWSGGVGQWVSENDARNDVRSGVAGAPSTTGCVSALSRSVTTTGSRMTTVGGPSRWTARPYGSGRL